MKTGRGVATIKSILGMSALCLVAGGGVADIVFEAGFNGPFSGIGGEYDKVTVGGTCALNTDQAGQVTSRIRRDAPLSEGGGYYS